MAMPSPRRRVPKINPTKYCRACIWLESCAQHNTTDTYPGAIFDTSHDDICEYLDPADGEALALATVDGRWYTTEEAYAKLLMEEITYEIL